MDTDIKPDVTIVVPVRNRIGMLTDLLDSLIAQQFPPGQMELIVVDGDSAEPVQETVLAAASRAPFVIRYLKVEEDHGPVSKRNLGVANARGAIIAFTDSDCRATPGWLQALTAPMADPAVGFVSGPVTYKPEQPKTFFSKLTAETLIEHPTYPTANVAYRRDLFLQMGGFDERLGVRDFLGRATECGDTDLAWRIRKAGWKNVFAPKALILHEVEDLSPLQWMLEPTRLILLPLLIRLHPEIAPRLLRWNIIFYPGTLRVYGALILSLVLVLIDPWLFLTAVVVGVLLLALLKARSPDPRRIFAALRDIGLHFSRMVVLAATLIAGSLRYGRLVL
ncbi:glycosyltransferase [Pseudotabrizicola sp. 4114]|uniref:glycosyltransferase n=1 Tax=Pseudotabrizicola sp. 4114 TaxID=2817731 RepID=UPI00285F8007|nr:cellulose synthase/poly-beta-1,6-N-acetylglucosamine synthase-like glycosyltransferase [Pseudorhodobacter sp. 4114]